MRLSYLFNLLAAVAVVGVADLRLRRQPGGVRADGRERRRVAVELARGRGDPRRLGPAARAQSSGTVTIGNRGSTATGLALEVAPESETAGTGGARIWDRCRSRSATGARVDLRGPRGRPGRLALGALAAGAERTYTITAWLPSGADDNALQGARLSLRFTWLAEPSRDARPTRPRAARRPPAGAPAAPAPDPDGADPNAAVSRREAHLAAAGQVVRQPPHGDGQVRRRAASRSSRSATTSSKQAAARPRAPRPPSPSAACRAAPSGSRSRPRSPTAASSRSSAPTDLRLVVATARYSAFAARAGELGDDRRGDARRGAGLDQRADGVDRRRVERRSRRARRRSRARSRRAAASAA